MPSMPEEASSGPVAQIASSIISEIDELSHGRYKVPETPDNITLLERWMANEGGLWADNPLNTSLNAASYPHQFNGSQDTGIPIYPSIATGVGATAQTLLQNPAYSEILSALSSGDVACQTFAAAVIRSPWASSHYGYDPARFCGGSVTSLKPPGTRGRRRA